MSDFRALCAELLAALEDEASNWNLEPEDHPLVERARAALAEPEPAGFRPTSLSPGALKQWDKAEAAIEASMARVRTLSAPFTSTSLLEHPNFPHPVSVRERWPGAEDYDEEGRCWIGYPDDTNPKWCLQELPLRLRASSPKAVWLPAHALPKPTND
jgi:hypothetical protein